MQGIGLSRKTNPPSLFQQQREGKLQNKKNCQKVGCFTAGRHAKSPDSGDDLPILTCYFLGGFIITTANILYMLEN